MTKIGVVGSGTMGIGIAQIAASNGCQVFLYDLNLSQSQQALARLQTLLSSLVEKGKITAQQSESIIQHIQICPQLSGLKDCDLIIEAIVENKEAKVKLFQELEEVVSNKCILATNTSSISITSIAAGLSIPERFLGIHFFNPAPLMPLVEIIPGLRTSPSLSEEIALLLKDWKKTPVKAKDLPGFIVNRIARPFYGEALRIVEEHLATPEQVDEAMKSLGNFKMGPFELIDLIGVDVNFAVTQTVYKDYFYDPKYKPSLLQQRMSEAKLLGRKTGKGFYDYTGTVEKVTPHRDEVLYREIFLRIISMLVNEAVEAKRLHIASDEDLEIAVQKGVNYPKGLLAWGQKIGYTKISETLDKLYQYYQEERYRQSPLLRLL
ncbi:3-hydroxyacyl-CoA dehydrogenase NAD-binding domain-containing protein [Elizabethkingia sp. JS20170427COW]|uniref:3-hydroxyacyl-CoA dehydrogenase NAD-binding domain-containing protein n=1 Tax=Elizabethkingia sp. JS20170427COW TaxID=2583851 RepID=UPI001110AA7A|nr:3-hydroxyacyl-CoA dehydrogenase NAD-binding domain-containing protein [Elizabethkingia sp. JS20170427COW]QCX52522.1 3-hydroxybutyryl-CoA dehydrogenase [Elizabethkingia sp. JS20170427COW]